MGLNRWPNHLFTAEAGKKNDEKKKNQKREKKKLRHRGRAPKHGKKNSPKSSLTGRNFSLGKISERKTLCGHGRKNHSLTRTQYQVVRMGFFWTFLTKNVVELKLLIY
uniref:hypothetical protein n=1 Tax=Cephaleuros parasiticus TaxID=173370 RepID=UPI001EE11E58|nr:hypothetical protein MFQ79_pgp008 [Cephaleuros parasiticus]UIB39054.1 hypothetical protein [Cephaleuros parasiticus]